MTQSKQFPGKDELAEKAKNLQSNPEAFSPGEETLDAASKKQIKSEFGDKISNLGQTLTPTPEKQDDDSAQEAWVKQLMELAQTISEAINQPFYKFGDILLNDIKTEFNKAKESLQSTSSNTDDLSPLSTASSKATNDLTDDAFPASETKKGVDLPDISPTKGIDLP